MNWIAQYRPMLLSVSFGAMVLAIGEPPALAQNGTYNPTQPCMPWPQCAAQPQGQGGSSSTPAPPPAPTHRWVNVAIALAQHPNADDVWVIWDTETNVKRVEESVVAACDRVMGSGCQIGMSGNNGAIAVARNPNGFISLGWGADAVSASKAARKFCADAQSQCTVEKTFAAIQWQKRINGNAPDRIKTYFPDASKALARIAIIAWPSSQPSDAKWFGKTWLSTGIRGRSDAERIVIAKCSADSGVPCVIGQGSIGGALVRYATDRDSNIYWMGVPSPREAETSLEEQCNIKMPGAKCRILNVYDSQSDSMQILDDSPGK